MALVDDNAAGPWPVGDRDTERAPWRGAGCAAPASPRRGTRRGTCAPGARSTGRRASPSRAAASKGLPRPRAFSSIALHVRLRREGAVECLRRPVACALHSSRCPSPSAPPAASAGPAAGRSTRSTCGAGDGCAAAGAPSRGAPRAAARPARPRSPPPRCGGSRSRCECRSTRDSRWRNASGRGRAGSRSCRCRSAGRSRRRSDTRPGPRASPSSASGGKLRRKARDLEQALHRRLDLRRRSRSR